MPVDCFPHSLPSGVRKVLRCAVCMERQTHYSGCDAPAAGDRCTSLNDCDGRATEFVDLSAPPLDADGEPTRLDALPWAVGRLGRRLGIINARAELFRFLDVETLTIRGAGCGRILVGPSCSPGFIEGAGGVDGGKLLLLPDWPNLDGLTDDDAERAIVAAALRARVGLGEVTP